MGQETENWQAYFHAEKEKIVRTAKEKLGEYSELIKIGFMEEGDRVGLGSLIGLASADLPESEFNVGDSGALANWVYNIAKTHMFTNRKFSYKKFDKNFYVKLLNIIPQNLSRKQTRNYLKEFEFKEVPDKDVKADEFALSNYIPVNTLYVSYGTKDKASIARLKIGFPLIIQPIFVWKMIANKLANQMFRKQLEKILDEKFESKKSSSGKVYWIKHFTVIKKKLNIEKEKPWIYIDVDCANTKIFPSKTELNNWIDS